MVRHGETLIKEDSKVLRRFFIGDGGAVDADWRWPGRSWFGGEEKGDSLVGVDFQLPVLEVSKDGLEVGVDGDAGGVSSLGGLREGNVVGVDVGLKSVVEREVGGVDVVERWGENCSLRDTRSNRSGRG